MAFDKQNGLIKKSGQLLLLRELGKIENVERSDMRMLETSRHRLRSRLKRFELPQLPTGSDAVDVRMYDTHNPGFCYRCTGAIRSGDKTPKTNVVDVSDAVHCMLFTDGEVDPDKVLCLHLLTAHCADTGSNEVSNMRPITPLREQGKKESFSGAWNHILPCYVVDIQRNYDYITDLSVEVKRHKDSLEGEAEVVKDFHSRYEKYLEENSDINLALSTNCKRASMAPNRIGKIAIIPPHVYSLLGAAQELKIKQAIADESRRKNFRRSSSSIRNIDDRSMSFRLDNDEDATSTRLITAPSIRGWTGPGIAGASKISGFQSLSRRSATSSRTTGPWSITTLNRASLRSSELPSLLSDFRTDPQIVMIKPSNRTIRCTVSKSSSTKSPFRNFSSTSHGPEFLCSNSTLGEARKIRGPIFLNSPVKSPQLIGKNYKTVPIMVNNQIQALVHSVMEVLERVNPSKMRKIVSTANSSCEIRKMLVRPDIQHFIDSLTGQPLISSPNSFVTSMASILHEIDPRVASNIEKEVIATTLAVPQAPGLDRFVEEIRSNLFVDPDQAEKRKTETMDIDSFESQRRKLLEFKTPGEKLDGNMRDAVFDMDTLCPHLDVQGNKMTCACCYTKWKDSLPDSERSLLPDFSFLSCHGSKMSPENGAIIDPDYWSKMKLDPNEESTDRGNTLPAKANPRKKGSPFTGSKTPKKSSLISTARNRKSSGKSMNDKAKLSGLKIPVKGTRISKESDKVTNSMAESITSTGIEQRGSEITLKDNISSTKCQFKPWKVSRDSSYLDPDRIILRRMTNPQRILVGQMCASIKTRKTNMEGIVKKRTPLAALIAPVLSNESLRVLTQGTRQARCRSRKKKVTDEKKEFPDAITEKLSGPVLAKVIQVFSKHSDEMKTQKTSRQVVFLLSLLRDNNNLPRYQVRKELGLNCSILPLEMENI